MCGICGLIALPLSQPLRRSSVADVRRAVEGLEHRGPDDKGTFGVQDNGAINSPVIDGQRYRLIFGHTRLSILDLSDQASQPMTKRFSGGESLTIVFNGEIYNYIELRNELMSLGYRFEGAGDTEVVLVAYAHWGMKVAEHLNGMWALAVYSTRRRTVFFSRDRVGIKPLYIRQGNETFSFASEFSALKDLRPDFPAEIDASRLADAVVNGRCDAGTDTMYCGVTQLPPASSGLLYLDSGKWHAWRYWGVPHSGEIELNNDSDALDKFEALLEDSARIRLRSDVPIAMTLSGGVDSSAVALASSRVTGTSLCAYTSHFPEFPSIDETRYARLVALHCNLDHHLISPGVDLREEDIRRTCRQQGLPFPTLSIYLHWSIMREIAKTGTKVVLSGQGGDEVLLGYERYFVTSMTAAAPNIIKSMVRALRAAQNSRLSLVETGSYFLYFNLPILANFHRRSRLLPYLRQCFIDRASPATAVPRKLSSLQRQELGGEQIAHLLRYDDRNASDHSLETRLPLLDYRLVEFCVGLSEKYKLRKGWSKWLLRRYLDRHGLGAIAWRRAKLGFNAPTEEWSQGLWDVRRRKPQVVPHALRDVARDDLSSRSSVDWAVLNLVYLCEEAGWKKVLVS